MPRMDKFIIIGAGPAGLMAAVTAADAGMQVMLFDKMGKIGLKMGITGKGRCNLTNSAPIGEFIAKTPGNGKFLFGAYRRFSNEDLLALFDSWGLITKTERGGRVFPKSDDAQEVRRLFLRLLSEKAVELHLKEAVHHLLVRDGQIVGVRTDKGVYEASNVLLCTGGKSYPRTGSTGDGYRMAQEVGHHVTEIRPSLIPLVCAEEFCKELQGLSLKNVTFSVTAGEKKKGEAFGEMLFTHFGISGPVVLSLSDVVSSWLHEGLSVTGEIDLKPALTEEVLDRRLLREIEGGHLKQVSTILRGIMPERLVQVILTVAKVSGTEMVAELKKEERMRLRKAIKHIPLTITGTRPIEEAIVTAGGVSVKDINASSMESKLVQGLYFAGEVIDIHAFTGGYNLQAAFSTGHLAAEAVVRSTL